MKVSIVIISYNQGQFIEETIKSVLAQTYDDTELLFVDGGSTDETMTIVEKYKEHFTVIIHEKDKGQTDAINKGFKLATGSLVGWVNSDDVLHPDCVTKIVACYENNQKGVIFYSETIDVIDSESKKIRKISISIPDREYLLKINYDVSQPGSFYSKETLEKIDYLDETLYYCMDLDLWLKLLDYGTIHWVEGDPLAGFREWGYTKTATGGHAFLKEIRKNLLKNGASLFSISVIKTYWLHLIFYVKQLKKM